MFLMHGDTPLRLAALPMHKFFNLHENPFTMDLDLSTIKSVMIKEDGSLISSFLDHNFNLALKSKQHVASSQVQDAMIWLDLENNVGFKAAISKATMSGITVNMEWVAPSNRIVIGYKKSNLVVLNCRNIYTGEYVDIPDYLSQYAVKCVTVGDGKDFCATAVNEVDKEGYVVTLADGTWFKLKTSWYLTLHRVKDNATSPYGLFEAIINEASDDIRAMLFDDELIIRKLDLLESIVVHKFNHLVSTVENFYADHKALPRKEYMILAKNQNDNLMPLYVNKYLGREVSYKEFVLKYCKSWCDEETSL